MTEILAAGADGSAGTIVALSVGGLFLLLSAIAYFLGWRIMLWIFGVLFGATTTMVAGLLLSIGNVLVKLFNALGK